jgi:hypothetical protein
MMLEFLYRHLWGKTDTLHDTVFRNFKFNDTTETDTDTDADTDSDTDTDTDTNRQKRSKKWTAEKLSVSGISSGAEPTYGACLPCGADELLVRKAYREMYDVLVAAQEERLEHLRVPERIPDRKKITLILGQPGIGKTWFLTYVLVRRILEGKPTIFQVANPFRGAGDLTDETHYLINGNGVRQMATPTLSELEDPDIWVLADQKPVGAPRHARIHRWLVVVTSSPRESNYHYVVKEYSPRTFYLPPWDWKEVAAAA